MLQGDCYELWLKGKEMTMAMKELVLLWMATGLVASEIMEVVDESNKTLTSIPTTYHSNTTKLILHHNSINMTILDAKALSTYPNITELDLSFNHISELPAVAFSALTNLEVLNLRGNRLQTIRNDTFSDLKKLKRLELQENPWNCTCLLLNLIKRINDSGVQTEGGTCAAPEELAKKSVPDVISACASTTKPPPVTTTIGPVTTATPATTSTATSTATTASTTTTTKATTVTTTAQRTLHVVSSTLGSPNISNKDSLSEAGKTGRPEPGVSNTWKFLAGVIVITLCTSMFIVCAVKSPSWYKLLFNYRHQRLREVDEPNVFSTGRYSNFSLDTEQTETSAAELDQGPEQPLEDEDGFIEDRYIQPEDYKDHTEDYKDHVEDYKDHADADEV
ncbi:leucine-rich repeat-containing protein 19-like [Colossoma macropomum]|uniref:leucine-rich repeat-containing protein 19-like n=1 Tax=Colossoma macropomum TaxID=42526 RepID=UPI001863BF3F|nr:leucine-rich repeat-containing protein 19-like [Colossoma macropomum]